jgi:ATP-dependent Clp protease ATP-binding subunit ClpB
MNLDQYTDRARSVLQAAQGLALKNKNQHFAPEHIARR